MMKGQKKMSDHKRVQIDFSKSPSMTKQAPAGMLTPAQIMKRFSSTGIDPMSAYYSAQFGDATKATSFMEATLLVQEASNAFVSLPSAVRERFKNDPGKLLEFLGDEKNYDEALSLGLVEKKEFSPVPTPIAEAEPPQGAAQQPSVVETVEN